MTANDSAPWRGGLAQLKIDVKRLDEEVEAALRKGDELYVTMLLASVSGQLKALAGYLGGELRAQP